MADLYVTQMILRRELKRQFPGARISVTRKLDRPSKEYVPVVKWASNAEGDKIRGAAARVLEEIETLTDDELNARAIGKDRWEKVKAHLQTTSWWTRG